MPPTFGSLFSGIGGFDLGFERAGWECRWQVEIDRDCQRVLARHWPGVKRYGDVREISGTQLEPVDAVVGGFPCQDLSVAGRREGLAGERSGLFFQFMRLAAELRPRWLVIENVPGLLSSNGTEDMGTLLGAVGDLGYWWAYRILDARHFGVAQRRRRPFIVADLGSRVGPAASLFEPESCARDPEAGGETGAGAAVGAGAGGRDVTAPVRTNVYNNSDPTMEAQQLVVSAAQPVGGGPDDDDAQAGHLLAVPDPAYTLADATGRRTGSGRDAQETYVVRTGGDFGDPDVKVEKDGKPMLAANPMSDRQMFILQDVRGHTTESEQNGPRWAEGDKTRLHPRHGVAYGISNTPEPTIDEEVMPTLQSKEAGGGRMEVVAFDWQAGGSENDKSFRGKSRSYVVRKGDYAQIRANAVDAVAFAENQRGEVRQMDVFPALGSGGGKPGSGYPVAAPLTGGSSPNSAIPGRHREDDENLVAEAKTFQNTGHGWWNESPVGQTLRTPEGGGSLEANLVAEPPKAFMVVRRLTPVECERLQGFPDGWTELGADGKPISESARYRMLGNAVCVPVAHWLALRLLAVIEGRDPNEVDAIGEAVRALMPNGEWARVA